MINTPPIARRELIAQRLDQGQTVVATGLADEFAVSEDAIRRDLRALAAQGRCRRVYGGALPISPMSASMNVRAAEDVDRKHTLAKAAAKLIGPDEVIFLDNGSANLALAAELPGDMGLKVITNSVPIASALFQRQDLDFMILGGMVDREVGGVIDASAVLAVQQLSIDRCFLGACALSVRLGVCSFDAGDAAFKRALVGVSETIMLMALTEKLQTRAPHRVATLEALDVLILEADAPQTIQDDFVQGGARIILG